MRSRFFWPLGFAGLTALLLTPAQGLADEQVPALHPSYAALFVVGNSWEFQGKATEESGEEGMKTQMLHETCTVTAVDAKPSRVGPTLRATLTCEGNSPGGRHIFGGVWLANRKGLLGPNGLGQGKDDLGALVPANPKPVERRANSSGERTWNGWSIRMGSVDVPGLGRAKSVTHVWVMPMGGGGSSEMIFAAGVGLFGYRDESLGEISSSTILSLVAFHSGK